MHPLPVGAPVDGFSGAASVESKPNMEVAPESAMSPVSTGTRGNGFPVSEVIEQNP